MNKIINIIQRNGVSTGRQNISVLSLPINRQIIDVFNTTFFLDDHLRIETNGKNVSVTLAGHNMVIQEDLDTKTAKRLCQYLKESAIHEASILTKHRYPKFS